MDKKKIKLIITIGLILILVGAVFIYLTKRNAPATMDNKINVVTSFYPLYFLVSQLGGDLVNASNLTPAGSEPHDYELTAQDIIKIKKSRLVFLNGGGLEAWDKDIKESIKLDDATIITLGDDLTSQEMNLEGEIQRDPHIWLSPILAIRMAEKITTELTRIDPQSKNYYESNLSVLKTKLINLDSAYQVGLKNCQRRDFITSHSAFGYLAQTYELKQVSIAGLSPEEEPSSQQLTEVAKFARENEIKYIFFESLTSSKLSETIAREVGAQTLVLNPIEGLSQEEINQGKNYLTEMEKNLENLKIALECD